MLDSCTVITCMQSWGRMDYARALVDIRVDRSLKDTMVISILNPIRNGVTMHTIKTTSTPVSNVFSTLEEDNGKPMDDLIDDTKKKVDASPMKTDAMEFDDTKQVVEKAEHENAYSKNG
ncbi:hypothetical protein Tco_1195029 [Tanacetum coccineum]